MTDLEVEERNMRALLALYPDALVLASRALAAQIDRDIYEMAKSAQLHTDAAPFSRGKTEE